MFPLHFIIISSSSYAILEDISISFYYFKNAQISKRKSRAPSLIAEPSLLNDKATQVERSLSNTNRSSKHNQQHRISSKKNDQYKKNLYFTDEELFELDELSLPEPVKPENIRNIKHFLHEAYHKEKIVCVVCDQICRISKSRILK